MAYIGIDAKNDIRLNATSDLDLTSDSTTIKFGADDDVTLTHVHNTGLLLNSTNQFQFGDSGTYIHQSADGVLDLVSDTEIEINATTIDINGAVDISGNATIGGSTVTDSNMLNIQGDGSSVNVGAVFNKTNSTAQIWSTQVRNSDNAFLIHNYTANSTPLIISTAGEATFSRADTGNVLKGTSTNNNTRCQLELTGKDSSGNDVTLKLGGDGDSGGNIFTFTNHQLGFATNNAAPQMVLDTNGHVFVAKTSSALATVGSELLNDGRIVGTANSQNVLLLNRKTSSGDVASFYVGGTPVGTIGSSGTENIFYFAGAASAIKILNPSTTGIDGLLPSTTSGGNRDNSMDLGASSARFKDLYLSGGAYIGGTGSANYLDDYEEGTWTPVYRDQSNASTLTITYDVQNGNYTKIGNTCIAHFSLGTDSVSGGSSSTYLAIGGLPFTSASDEARGSLIIGGKYSWPGNQPTQGSLFASNTIHNLWQGTSAAPNVATDQLGTGANSNRMHGTIIYKTA